VIRKYCFIEIVITPIPNKRHCMHITLQRSLISTASLALVLSLSACSKENKAPENKASASASAAASSGKATNEVSHIIISKEDVMTLNSQALASGPVVIGTIQAERKADLRAEVGAVVMQVLKENGDVVKKGDLLVRLDETAIRDNLQSADDSVKNAALALEQAERQVQRLKTLRASGMTSMQALDDAELRRNAALSEVSSAKARATSARQQLQRTAIRAPFDGVVSERKVSSGDTAAPGKELLKVIDPTSMRFAGRVSADKISQIKAGQKVSFRVNGYSGQVFNGQVQRVDVAANDVTRQVEVLVKFADANQPRVSGLYAEGNIEAEAVAALMLPEQAIVRSGDMAHVWTVKAKVLNKVAVVLGKRDARTGEYEVRQGLASGDIVMRNPTSKLKEGQKVEVASANLALANNQIASAATATAATAATAASTQQGK
jgi:membrane fusion protein (multidrug efflux system)